MASIKLPDGSIKEIPDGSSVQQLAESIGKGLARAAIAGRVDGKVVDQAILLQQPKNIMSFAQDSAGELYVLTQESGIYQLIAEPK